MFFIEKGSSLASFWLYKLPKLTSFKSNANEFSIFCIVPKNDLNGVSSCNLNTKKDHENKVFL